MKKDNDYHNDINTMGVIAGTVKHSAVTTRKNEALQVEDILAVRSVGTADMLTNDERLQTQGPAGPETDLIIRRAAHNKQAMHKDGPVRATVHGAPRDINDFAHMKAGDKVWHDDADDHKAEGGKHDDKHHDSKEDKAKEDAKKAQQDVHKKVADAVSPEKLMGVDKVKEKLAGKDEDAHKKPGDGAEHVAGSGIAPQVPVKKNFPVGGGTGVGHAHDSGDGLPNNNAVHDAVGGIDPVVHAPGGVPDPKHVPVENANRVPAGQPNTFDGGTGPVHRADHTPAVWTGPTAVDAAPMKRANDIPVGEPGSWVGTDMTAKVNAARGNDPLKDRVPAGTDQHVKDMANDADHPPVPMHPGVASPVVTPVRTDMPAHINTSGVRHDISNLERRGVVPPLEETPVGVARGVAPVGAAAVLGPRNQPVDAVVNVPAKSAVDADVVRPVHTPVATPTVVKKK